MLHCYVIITEKLKNEKISYAATCYKKQEFMKTCQLSLQNFCTPASANFHNAINFHTARMVSHTLAYCYKFPYSKALHTVVYVLTFWMLPISVRSWTCTKIHKIKLRTKISATAVLGVNRKRGSASYIVREVRSVRERERERERERYRERKTEVTSPFSR